MSHSIMLAVFLTLLVTLQPPLGAQSSRADEHAARQAQKARETKPYEMTRAERLVLRLERGGLFGLPIGLYPFIGSIYPGGRIAAGPAIRLPFSDTGAFAAQTAWSVRSYKLAGASVKLPDLAGGHVHVIAEARLIDAPRVAFYGLGPDSARADRTTFRYQPKWAGVKALVKAGPAVAGGGFDYLAIETGQGRGGSPSIETRFTPAAAPGLGLDPTYGVARLFAQLDWRESPGYSTRGGLYRVDVADYRERDHAPYDFRRVDVELDQFVPLLRANWVLAFRAAASITSVTTGDQVPYFMLPTLGSGSELRAYRSLRFRDRHRLLLTAEYRWRPSRLLDMALFYEAGKVASRRADLDLEHLRHAYGIGARLHTPAATILRLEVARGDEGSRLILAGGPAF